jgi:hypothetical protein
MSPSSPNKSPIDRPVLEDLRNRLQTSNEFSVVNIETTPKTRLMAEYDCAYYPASVDRAYLDVRWYTNNDFSIHYHEERTDSQWDRRWDRHSNPHNSREHYHLPPDGQFPAEDATFPDEYHDVIQLVLQKNRERITELWE